MTTTQKGTEGILNKVNERYGCNQKRRTISVQNLIRFHKPKTAYNLRELIKSHHKDNAPCECGSVANGSIDDWADRLYQSYLKMEAKDGPLPYKNLEDCKIFMNYLFVEGSIKGGLMEKEAMKLMNKCSLIKDNELKVKMASEEYDFKYSVDLVIYHGEQEVMGIQVKPETYKHFGKTSAVYMQNKSKNDAYHKEVFYLYYDKNDKFIKQSELYSEFNRIFTEHKLKQST